MVKNDRVRVKRPDGEYETGRIEDIYDTANHSIALIKLDDGGREKVLLDNIEVIPEEKESVDCITITREDFIKKTIDVIREETKDQNSLLSMILLTFGTRLEKALFGDAPKND